jgi:hypothetical protein
MCPVQLDAALAEVQDLRQSAEDAQAEAAAAREAAEAAQLRVDAVSRLPFIAPVRTRACADSQLCMLAGAGPACMPSAVSITVPLIPRQAGSAGLGASHACPGPSFMLSYYFPSVGQSFDDVSYLQMILK